MNEYFSKKIYTGSKLGVISPQRNGNRSKNKWKTLVTQTTYYAIHSHDMSTIGESTDTVD